MNAHLATIPESQTISELFSNSKSLGNYSISFHPMNGWNEEKRTYENPDGSPVLAYIGIRIYKHSKNGWSESVYSEDLI